MSRLWVILTIVLGILVVAFFVGAVGMSMYSTWKDLHIAGGDSLVLRLDFSRGVPEMHSLDPFQRFAGRGTLTLLEVDRALTHAAADDGVHGLVLDLSGIQMGSAQLEEIRDAVLRFRDTGKWAIAYADSFFTGGTGTGVYYLASACDEIYMHRAGDVGFSGLAMQPLFFAGTFEKLGIKPVMGQRYEYKTLINMYTETGYTEPQREIEQRLLDGMMTHILDGVSKGRGIPVERLETMMNDAPFIGREAMDAGLIDGFRYWDEVKERIDERVGDPGTILKLSRYYKDAVPDLEQSNENIIALVYGVGEVIRGEAAAGFTGKPVMASKTVSRAIRQIREDEDVDAVVFRVDSPGGSHNASDTIAHEIRLTRDEGIPVVVSMGDVAASGGYYVSMYADVIMAEPLTITGSIGVAGGKFVVTDFLRRIGVTTDSIQFGDHALLMSFFRDVTPSEQERFNRMLDRIYADFTGEVMASRDLSETAMDTVARGRVWIGTDALENGLIDELGGLHDALITAGDLAGIDPSESITIRIYPREQSLWELLTDPDADYITTGYRSFVNGFHSLMVLGRLADQGLLSDLMEMTRIDSMHALKAQERVPIQ